MLIADRFLSLNGRTIDLASGDPILFRRLPTGERAEQVAWSERCAAITLRASRRGTRLIGYGLLNDGGRFEAYRLAAGGGRVCVPAADLERVKIVDNGGGWHARRVAREDRLAPWLQQAVDLLETGSYGEPRRLSLPPDGASSARAIDLVARRARLLGFVPVSVDLFLDAEHRGRSIAAYLRDIVNDRHLLLIARNPILCTGHGWCASRAARIIACPVGIARLLIRTGAAGARPNVLMATANEHRQRARALPACLRPGAHHVSIEKCWQPTGQSMVSAARSARTMATTAARGAAVAAETHESYRVSVASDLVRLRARAAEIVDHATGGQPVRAEHDLRDVMGALARRNDACGTGWVGLSLGMLLLDRGRALDAARTFETARTEFDRVNDLPGAVRATTCLGLAWTDEGRFAEAEAACRTAAMAAGEVQLVDLSADANLALARCLYWQARFDEATILTAALRDQLGQPTEPGSTTDVGGAGQPVGVVRPGRRLREAGRDAEDSYQPDAGARSIAIAREAQPSSLWDSQWPAPPFGRVAPGDGDRRVRLLALATRLSLARGDVPAAAVHGSRALDTAVGSARAIDECVARTALAAVQCALHDTDRLRDHVRAGLAAARRAHAPLGALRLRLLACDGLRLAGRQKDAAALLRHLARLDLARFPGLLRARVQLIVSSDGGLAASSEASLARSASAALAVAACPWRFAPAALDLGSEIAAVLQVCHDVEDEEAALGRVCSALRERTRAVAVGVVGRHGAAPALLGRAGPAAGRSTLTDRVLETGVPVPAATSPLGIEAAAPIRYAGATIGVVSCRWPADALVDPPRAGCLLSAAAAATAPHVRTLLDRRQSPPLATDQDDSTLVGVSEAMQGLRKAATRAAGAPFPVMIEGESGSGKELVARAIHRDSPRRARRFCALNCAAISDELLEAELFGHARGAFTGAVTDRVGLFEEADGGTLFLDEVADLSARAQAKLLRVLQDGEVRRVGENFTRHVDARVIAATNRSLQAAVGAGTFRRDLFYRLNVVHIDVPPLRDRPEDIAVLAGHFWARSAARIGSRATLAPATLAALAEYDWPGNVRELQNVMASLAVEAPRRGSVGPACLPPMIAQARACRTTLDAARRVFERRFVQAALARAGGQRSRAAAALGISRQGLVKLIARLDLGADGSED